MKLRFNYTTLSWFLCPIYENVEFVSVPLPNNNFSLEEINFLIWSQSRHTKITMKDLYSKKKECICCQNEKVWRRLTDTIAWSTFNVILRKGYSEYLKIPSQCRLESIYLLSLELRFFSSMKVGWTLRFFYVVLSKMHHSYHCSNMLVRWFILVLNIQIQIDSNPCAIGMKWKSFHFKWQKIIKIS